jgi:hypothetical protein
MTVRGAVLSDNSAEFSVGEADVGVYRLQSMIDIVWLRIVSSRVDLRRRFLAITDSPREITPREVPAATRSATRKSRDDYNQRGS